MRWFLGPRARSRREDRGATAVEYGIIAAAVGAAAIGGFFAISNALNSSYQTTASDPGVCLGSCDAIAGDVPPAIIANTVALGAPGPPRNVIAQVISATSIRVAWNAPSSTGGSSITGYSISTSPAPNPSQCTSLTNTTFDCTFTSLTAQAYTFTVSASNSFGSTSAGAVSATPVTPTVPSPPSSVTVSTTGVVSWIATPVGSNGGSVVVSYTAEAFSSLSGGSAVGSCTVTGATATTCKVSGLSGGTTYYFSVFATNIAGSGTATSPRVSGSIASPPLPPTGVAVSNIGAVSWTATPAGSNGGSAVTSYVATAYDAASGGGLVGSCSVLGPTATGCTLSNLTPQATIFVSVAAKNDIGTGSSSSPRVSRTLANVPSAPTGVAMSNTGVVTWTAIPAGSNGGSAVTGYRANVFTSASGGTAVASCNVTGPTATGCSVTGLDTATAYWVEAFGSNAMGAGTASSPRSTVTTASLPGAPTGLGWNSGANKISWTAPSSNGGASITKYTATAWTASSGGSSAGSCTWTSGSQLDCVISGLTKGATYYFEVIATNAMGDGPPSIRLADKG